MEKERIEVMIDIETVSKSVNGGILSIAAVPFSLFGEARDKIISQSIATFDRSIDLTSCFLSGMDMNGCQEFWMKQPKVLIDAMIAKEKVSIFSAISDFHGYLSVLADEYDLFVWSRGIDFDFPKLQWCFENIINKPAPYQYNRKRDVRTFVDDFGIIVNKIGTAHCAVDDCKNQIRDVLSTHAQISRAIQRYAGNSVKKSEE